MENNLCGDCFKDSNIELTILMPCLNEEKTVGSCIDEAREFLSGMKCKAEILIADNGSTDNSVQVAKDHGSRVVICNQKGYGNILRYGLKEARGKYIILGDCDMSYSFMEINEMYNMLVLGYDMVIGNRFAKKPSRDAMSVLHQLGVRFLSFLARNRFNCDIVDFHCGLRGCNKEAVCKLAFHSTGMEFATEMIGKAVKANLKVGQAPVKLRVDNRNGKSHLRTFRDGFRHLWLILTMK